MRRHISPFVLTSVLLLAIFTSFAGNGLRRCSSYEVLQRQLKEDPSMQQRIDRIEQFTSEYSSKSAAHRSATSSVSIPVVFHVLYNTSAQNVSDAMIQSQLDVLNADYSGSNTDIAVLPSVFAGIKAGNSGIQFCLAKRDPNGNATTGIIHKSTASVSFIDDDKVKSSSTGGDNAWDATKYLNIWICNLGNGLLGYAQFPGGPASTDGVVVLYSSLPGGTSVPYDKGRTLTHEVGHWLNLRHIWGDGTCADDLVSDTPTQETSNFGCPAFPHVTCSNGPNGDLFENYMDYTDDACMYMFTAGQATRMNAIFATGGARASITASLGCVAPASCGTPSGLTASSITTSGATLSWTAVSGATSYNIQYKSASATTWTTVTSTTNSKILTGLISATTYNYQVQAMCEAAGTYSTVASFTTTSSSTCETPSGLIATGITATAATLNWSAVSGATKYNVQYKKSSATSWTTVTSTTNSKPLTGLTANTTYNFKVQAVCSATGAYSGVISFATAATCNSPKSLSATSITYSGATLNWGAVSGAVSYNIQFKPSTSSTWVTVTSTTNSKILTGLSASTKYSYQVQAVCAYSGTYSSAATFTTAAAPAACVDSYESNNTFGTAAAIPVNTDIKAAINTGTDVDWFKFTTTSAAPNFKVTLTNLPQDFDLELYNASETFLITSDNAGTTAEGIVYNAAPVGTYYVKVLGYGGVNSASCYTLKVQTSNTTLREIEPDENKSDLRKGENVAIYPNPSSGNFMVKYLSDSNKRIVVSVYDLSGKIVRMENVDVTEGENLENINLQDEPNGLYIVGINDGSVTSMYKIMIRK